MVDPLVLGIIGMSIALVGTILMLLWYSGLFVPVEIGTGKSRFGPMKIAYKFRIGPYKNCGSLFTEATTLAPTHRCIGIYYDNPEEVEAEKCRYIVGVILAENDEEPDKKLEIKMKANGFKLFSFPAIDHAVKTTFPYVWDLSIYIAVYKVYTSLNRYVHERKLSATTAIEIYENRTIHYLMPLSKQDAYHVPEVADDYETEDQSESSPNKLLTETKAGEKEKEDSGGESSSSFEQLDAPKENIE